MTVFRGEEISTYNDSSGALDDMDDEHFATTTTRTRTTTAAPAAGADR